MQREYVRETGYSDAELLKRGLLRNASRSKRGALIGRHAREAAIAAMEDDDAAKAFSVQQLHGSSTGRLEFHAEREKKNPVSI